MRVPAQQKYLRDPPPLPGLPQGRKRFGAVTKSVLATSPPPSQWIRYLETEGGIVLTKNAGCQGGESVEGVLERRGQRPEQRANQAKYSLASRQYFRESASNCHGPTRIINAKQQSAKKAAQQAQNPQGSKPSGAMFIARHIHIHWAKSTSYTGQQAIHRAACPAGQNPHHIHFWG